MTLLQKLFSKNKKSPAFTLVEIVAVLFIISIGLLGVVSLLIQNIRSQSINKNGVIAYQLAQEGIELVRKTRDTNWKNEPNWNENLATGDYYMDYTHSIPQVLNSPTDARLFYNASGFYDHNSSGESTIFNRVIKLVDLDVDTIGVKVEISWGDRDRQHTYTLDTILYNWWGI